MAARRYIIDKELNETAYINKVLSVAMDIGRSMLKCGAEVRRVEDSIGRICAAYGCSRADVFTITSEIVATASRGEISCTQSRRIHFYSYNLKQLEELNALSREICCSTPNPADIHKDIEAIVYRNKIRSQKKYFGMILAAGSFTLFFGGTFWDALVSLLIASIVFSIDYLAKRGRINMLAYAVTASCIAGFFAVAAIKLIPSLHLDQIIIGNVMLMIPGIGLTNGIRDLLGGDIVSGLLRLSEAVLVSISIAVGFSIPILVLGGLIL